MASEESPSTKTRPISRHEVFGKAGLFGRRMLRKIVHFWLSVCALKRVLIHPCLSKLWPPPLPLIQAKYAAHCLKCWLSVVSHTSKAPTVSPVRESRKESFAQEPPLSERESEWPAREREASVCVVCERERLLL